MKLLKRKNYLYFYVFLGDFTNTNFTLYFLTYLRIQTGYRLEFISEFIVFDPPK